MKRIFNTATALFLSLALPFCVYAFMPGIEGGYLETAAGTGSHGAWDGGISQFNLPMSLVFDGSRIMIADTFNNVLRIIDADGEVSTFAGVVRETAPDNFPRGFYRDGALYQAGFNRPVGIAVNPVGHVFVADGRNHAIRILFEDRSYTFTGGLEAGFADGNAYEAMFNMPSALAFGTNGYLYVADAGNHVIRRISPARVASTIAGVPGVHGHEDGAADSALFDSPMGIAVSPDGVIFVADTGNHRIRAIENGEVRTLAGRTNLDGTDLEMPTGGFNDGNGENALFNMPMGIAYWDGYLFVADSANHSIRVVSMNGETRTLFGNGYPGYVGGAAGYARLHFPMGVYVRDGRLLIVDTGNNKIRETWLRNYENN